MSTRNIQKGLDRKVNFYFSKESELTKKSLKADELLVKREETYGGEQNQQQTQVVIEQKIHDKNIGQQKLCCRTFFSEMQIVKQPESDTCEFKMYSFPFNREKNVNLQRAICGFLNHRGGNIYIGIQENVQTKQHRIIGDTYNQSEKEEVLKIIRELSQCIEPDILVNNKIKISFVPVKSKNPPYRYICGRYVIKIKVLQGVKDQIYTIKNQFGEYFLSIRTENQVLVLDPKKDLRRLLAIQKERVLYPYETPINVSVHVCQEPEEGLRLFQAENRLSRKRYQKRQKNVQNSKEKLEQNSKQKLQIIKGKSKLTKKQLNCLGEELRNAFFQSEGIITKYQPPNNSIQFENQYPILLTQQTKQRYVFRYPSSQEEPNQISKKTKGQIFSNFKNESNDSFSIFMSQTQKLKDSNTINSNLSTIIQDKNSRMIQNHYEKSIILPNKTPEKKQQFHQNEKLESQKKFNFEQRSDPYLKFYFSKFIAENKNIGFEGLRSLNVQLKSICNNKHRFYAFIGFSKTRTQQILSQFKKIGQFSFYQLNDLLLYKFNKNTNEGALKLALARAIQIQQTDVKLCFDSMSAKKKKKTSFFVLNEAQNQPQRQKPQVNKKSQRTIFKIGLKFHIPNYYTLSRQQILKIKNILDSNQPFLSSRVKFEVTKQLSKQHQKIRDFDFSNICDSLISFLQLRESGIEVQFF